MGIYRKKTKGGNPGSASGDQGERRGEAALRSTPELSLDYLGKGFPALHDVRDSILLLSLGNAFLCEDVFLRKMGNAIEAQLGHVRQEISELKTRFPGKFAEEIDTGPMIRDLQAHSERLKHPDKAIMDHCATGSLGRGMEETLDALTGAVRRIKRRVEGETPLYTARDSVLGVIDKAKTPVSMVKRLVSLTVKTLLVLAVLALGPLTYFIVTMDREGALLEEIAESEAAIRSKQEAVASMEREREALRQEIDLMQAEDAPREKKFAIMELNVKAHTLDQNRHRAEAEISAEEERIRTNRRRLRDVREKPFLDRLLGN